VACTTNSVALCDARAFSVVKSGAACKRRPTGWRPQDAVSIPSTHPVCGVMRQRKWNRRCTQRTRMLRGDPIHEATPRPCMPAAPQAIELASHTADRSQPTRRRRENPLRGTPA